MPTPKPFTHVIFDLDGTLLDTLDDLANSVNWVCRQHGWPTHERDAYKYFVGNGVVRLLERATPEQAKRPGVWEQVQEEFQNYYGEHKTDNTRPYEGMEQVLEELKKAGVSIAVLTNKPDTAAQGVMERYYPGVFPFVQGSLPEQPVKPDPTLLFRVMERMDARPETTLFVGDSNVDIQTAKNGGIASCGVLWGFRTRQELENEGADHIACASGELLNIILRQR